jgi:hypothetical protein
VSDADDAQVELTAAVNVDAIPSAGIATLSAKAKQKLNGGVQRGIAVSLSTAVAAAQASLVLKADPSVL